MKRGSEIFTLYTSIIYYFLVASETKCLLYRILGVGDGKKKLKETKKSQRQKKEKKSSGPKRDDTVIATSSASC